jgi:hypothetical protein
LPILLSVEIQWVLTEFMDGLDEGCIILPGNPGMDGVARGTDEAPALPAFFDALLRCLADIFRRPIGQDIDTTDVPHQADFMADLGLGHGHVQAGRRIDGMEGIDPRVQEDIFSGQILPSVCLRQGTPSLWHSPTSCFR